MKTKSAIIKLLKLSELEYGQLVEKFAYEYVAYYCAGCIGAVEYLTFTGSFWKWWLLHFDIRDQVFLTDYSDYAGASDELKEWWCETHCPVEIEGRMPGPIWREILATITAAPHNTDIKTEEARKVCAEHGWNPNKWQDLKDAVYILKKQKGII